MPTYQNIVTERFGEHALQIKKKSFGALYQGFSKCAYEVLTKVNVSPPRVVVVYSPTCSFPFFSIKMMRRSSAHSRKKYVHFQNIHTHFIIYLQRMYTSIHSKSYFV
jgi:hypothetical protein